ncbi:tRNA-dihydrouridine synthase [Candidatus Saccharibacteria bacterium]|nr:tRNA-dihydrouridine synthase [Candidatus Saccharibacteria bacterium]
MDDVTDTVFRQVVHTNAPADLYFTEFVNVDGLQSPGRPKLLKKLRFAATEGPLIAQLWGLIPENFEKTASEIADGTFARELGLPSGINFKGVDLNMGCPAKSEVKNGTCSALMNNRPLAHEIIKATKRGAGKMPVSVKTRLGWSEIDYSWHEFLLGHNLDMLTIHGRTRREMSKVPAHWDAIGEIVKIRDKIAKDTLIIGNGDILTKQQGRKLAKEYDLDGIMIGRGLFENPFCLSEDGPRKWENYDVIGKIKLFREHVELFADTWREGERPLHTLNKFCKVYISGFDGAKEMREKLMNCQTITELYQHLQQ